MAINKEIRTGSLAAQLALAHKDLEGDFKSTLSRLLENFGFSVIDLPKEEDIQKVDFPDEDTVLDVLRKHGPQPGLVPLKDILKEMGYDFRPDGTFRRLAWIVNKLHDAGKLVRTRLPDGRIVDIHLPEENK